MGGSRHALKTISFEGELLPDWAQLLALAARLADVSRETQNWFSRFTQKSGADDSRTVLAHCEVLRHSLHEQRNGVIGRLEHGSGDSDAPKISRRGFMLSKRGCSRHEVCKRAVGASKETGIQREETSETVISRCAGYNHLVSQDVAN